ncbi:MAG: GTP 3',8-cyclase MoaA [Betaproteobacteria bacterium TMED156]|nr:MAG: GTP 3',8-cyclase MoaA [Betaproteobacteria bacterium TMED156]
MHSKKFIKIIDASKLRNLNKSDEIPIKEFKDDFILDNMGRQLTDLRISLIDKCNFRCSYCMPKSVFNKNYRYLKDNQMLSFSEIILLVKAFATLGVEKIRLTGGEPLLKKNIEKLVSEINLIKTTKNLPIEIALTTNGTLLKKKARDLFNAGLKRVTVSLDSIDQKIFESMSDSKFKVGKVLKGIEHAVNIGLNVKINMVVKKGINENQILPMATYFKNRAIPLRFIEFMDVGSTNAWRPEKVVTSKEIVKILQQNYGIRYIGRDNVNEVSERWRYEDDQSEVGLISSVSKPFCSNCSRARISADGFLYTCLFSSYGNDLKPLIRAVNYLDEKKFMDQNLELIQALTNKIAMIWGKRQDQYSNLRYLNSGYTSNTKKQKIEMSYIGG